ncbi:MAG: hypothetical protein AB1486_27895 [Planctomycetota bacterium]
MKVEELREFLESRMTGQQLAERILAEVERHRQAAKRGKDVLPVYAEGATDLLVVPGHIGRICEAFLDGSLDADSVTYMSTVMELSESFTVVDEKVRYALFLLANPEVNIPITSDLAERLRLWSRAPDQDLEHLLMDLDVRTGRPGRRRRRLE